VDGDELRQVQGPLKERYRAEPSAAVITLRAEGSLAASDVSCSVQTGRALVEAGLHAATGGDGTPACSGDLLLQALVACAGVTLRSVATKRGIAVSGSMRAESELVPCQATFARLTSSRSSWSRAWRLRQAM
jgi:hypothetical protein